MNVLSFYRMETDEISKRYIAQCFANGLEAFDGEINLTFDENLISNEFTVKLCLDYEFIINPEEDDFVPGVILGISFLRLSRGIIDFSNGRQTSSIHIGPSTSSGRYLTQEEEEKEELAIRISQIYALLEEERHVIETMAYNDKYKKILNEILKDNVELDGKTIKEDEESVKELKKVDRGITMIDHTQAEAMGKLSNVLYQVGVTRIIAKFLILDIPIDRDAPIMVGRGFLRMMGSLLNTSKRIFSTFDGVCHQTFRAARFDVLRTAESDSDDEEEYVIKRNKFGAPIYGPRPAPYLNCANPEDRSSAIQAVTNPFRKISVWKKAVSFLGSLPVPLKQVNWKPDYKGSYTKEEEATGQWRTEIRLTDPYGNIYLQGFTTKKTDQKLSKYHKLSDIMSPNWFME
ncbi:hypothetical protein Tco_0779720 [Tanacetum coccineum]